MCSIYCLYSTCDGRPRYIGQTTKPVAVRLAQHLRNARRTAQTPLSQWIRATLAGGFTVRIYTLQTAVAPADLNLFEIYWMGQFSGLLNASSGMPRSDTDSAVATALYHALQAGVPAADQRRS